MKYDELKPEQRDLIQSFAGLYRLTAREFGAVMAQVEKVVDVGDSGALELIAALEDGVPNIQGISGAQSLNPAQILADVAEFRAARDLHNTDAKRQERIKAGGL